MALDLTTNPGGLFPRIGRIGKIAYSLNTFQSPMATQFNNIVAQYASTLQDVGGLVAIQQNSLIRSTSGIMGFASAAATQTILKMVEADNPPMATSFFNAMTYVIEQMIAQAATVNRCTVSVTPTVLTGSVGNGAIVTTTKRGDGLVQENLFAESMRLACVSDSYTGGATAGQEVFTLRSETALAGVWDWDYPQGSGLTTQTSAVSASTDASTGSNLLTNGDMESWNTDVPPELNNWVLEDGTWGTDIQRGATPNRGTYSLQFLPTANDTEIYQQFGDATNGTSVTMTPLFDYAVNLWLRENANTASAGVLTVALVDSLGAVINDDQGVANSFTIDCTALGSTFVARNGVFRLPSVPPSVVRLQLRMSTALAGDSVFVDDICLARMQPTYSGGFFYSVFSGATNFVNGDGWSIVTTNNRAGASFLATFQSLFDRLLPMRQNGFLLPSAAVGTILDTLITA